MSKRPTFRIIANPKKNTDAEGEEPREVAVLWPSKFEGCYNLQAHTDTDQFKRPLAEVLNGNYWLNVNPNKPPEEEF